MTSVYTYETLRSDEIRLLSLFPESDGEDLAGILSTVSLRSIDDKISDESAPGDPIYELLPEYKALSYCWGQQEATARLWLSNTIGGTTRPYLPIKPNLESALKKLRRDIRPGGQMNLWTDAICINQRDIPERNGQIKKMADIYSEAVEVHIWLGDEEEDSDSAMKFARQIKNPQYFQQALKEDRSAEWVAFHRLIHRDWFSRRWIVQEISLARTAIVHCGNECIKWDELEEAVSILADPDTQNMVRDQVRASKLHGNPFDALGEINGTGALHLVEIAFNVAQHTRTSTGDRSVMQHRMSLEGLMSSLTMFETSDPYDIVNALLWLAHDVKPDAALSDVNNFRTVRSPLEERSNSWLRNSTPSPRPGTSSESRAHTSYGSSRRLNVDGDAGRHERKLSVSDVLKKEEQRLRGTAERLVVNYNMSLFECYKNFLEHIFKRSKSLDIICRAWALSPKEDPPPGAPSDWKAEQPLPTWMKTLDENKIFNINPAERVCERVRADPLVGRPGTGPRPYNACGMRKHEGTVHDQNRCLKVRGFALGDVRECGDAASKGNIPEEWLTRLGWTSQPTKRKQAQSDALGGAGRPNWLWRFLVAEKGNDGYQPPPMRFRSNCTWLLDNRTPRTGLGTDYRPAWPLLLRNFVNRVRAVVWERRLITIRYGSSGDELFGMAPKETRLNDTVCILFGCSVPVVLRKVKTIPHNPPSTAPTIIVREATDHRSDSEPNPKRPRLDTSVAQGEREDFPLVESPVHLQAPQSLRNGAVDFETSDETYELIGECYVYGMMAGEAFKHCEDNKIPKRWWTLV